MIESFRNIFALAELRRRLAFTFGLLAVYRLGAFIVTPGINSDVIKRFFEQMAGTMFGLFSMFSGGAVEQLSIWADRIGVQIVKHDQGADPGAVGHAVPVVSPTDPQFDGVGESDPPEKIGHVRARDTGVVFRIVVRERVSGFQLDHSAADRGRRLREIWPIRD